MYLFDDTALLLGVNCLTGSDAREQYNISMADDYFMSGLGMISLADSENLAFWRSELLHTAS